MKILICVFLVVATSASAQPAPKEFPPDAVPISAASLRERLANKVYRVQLADGGGWRIDYRANGYYFVNTNEGYSDTGKWTVQECQLCSVPRKTAPACNEVREVGDPIIYLKRLNGDIIQLKPQ